MDFKVIDYESSINKLSAEREDLNKMILELREEVKGS